MSFDHWAAFVLGTYQETRIGWRSHKVVMKPHKLRVLANDLDVFLLEPREGGLRVAEGGGQQQRHEKEDERGQINKFDSGMEATWQQQLVVMCLSYGGVDVKLDFVCLIERICNLDIQRLIAGWCSNMCLFGRKQEREARAPMRRIRGRAKCVPLAFACLCFIHLRAHSRAHAPPIM